MASQRKRQRVSSSGTSISTAHDEDHVDRIEPAAEKGAAAGETDQGGRSLFVRSLPSTVTSDNLTQYFSESFPVKHATVVLDPTTKQSRGYGFVTFADAEDAKQAAKEFNGKVLDGRRIKVEIAKPRHRQVEEIGVDGPKSTSLPSATANGKAERAGGKIKAQPQSKLIVRNLPWSVKDPEQLATLFRSYGKVKHVTIPPKKNGLSAGFAFVVMRGRKNADKAMHGVTGKEVDGRTLAVDWAVEKEVWENLQTGDVVNTVNKKQSQNEGDEDEREGHDSSTSAASDIDNRISTGVKGDEMTVDKSADGDPLDDSVKTHEPGDNSSTLFVRNLPFTSTDEVLHAHFSQFGPVRYARAVVDHVTERPKGTAFVCFYNKEDADGCLRQAPITNHFGQFNKGEAAAHSTQYSVLEDTNADPSGRYTMDGRVLQLSRAVSKGEAFKLTEEGSSLRDKRDRDKRRLYLLSEGTVPSNSPLYAKLAPSEIKMREASVKQRQSLVKSNATLHISLTRLSVRNIPRGISSKDLKALAREAVVGFAKDVKGGVRSQLSKEELERGSVEMREAERSRKAKGKGIVRQAKIVFEGREGGKVTEDSGAGRSRGYGFIEYVSHRWALMGLRWLNGHALGPDGKDEKSTSSSRGDITERNKRLIVEFAIENAQVVGRRQEREAKARERSKSTMAKIESGTLPQAGKKILSKDSQMARTRKGVKRKRDEGVDNRVTKKGKENPSSTKGGTNTGQQVEADILAKRQQIIAKKRMMRKAKKKA